MAEAERQEPLHADESLEVDFALSHKFANFREAAEEANRQVADVMRIQEIIDRINSGELRPTQRIRTFINDKEAASMTDDSRRRRIEGFGGRLPDTGTIIYRQNGHGQYVPDGEITTPYHKVPKMFLGDRVLQLEDESLVIINSELGIGVTPFGRVEIIDDPKRTVEKVFLDDTMSLINQVPSGERRQFNQPRD